MPDLLLELFSEEIPARMQQRASEDLKALVTDALVEQGLAYEGAQGFATPRRLTLVVAGLPARQPDRLEERKGPRVGAPEGAIQGFLKAAGLSSIEEARIQDDPKGAFYVAATAKLGRTTAEVVADVVPAIIRRFPWPKSMRWGSGTLRWVRPLHAVVCTLATPHEEPEVIGFEIDGVHSGDVTFGHRFHAPQPITVRRFDDYVRSLGAAHVILDPERRRQIIRHDARTLATAQGFEVIEDDALLDEVAGLVEWPVVLMGSFEEAFLDVPPEVIRTTIRANQKCFVMTDRERGRLANRFLLVANIEARDGGAAIVAGNERVVRARLSDAKFFWETDKKIRLEDRLPKLKSIVFHAKIGTQRDRVDRIARLATAIAPFVKADVAEAERAALLAKADLVTEMVGEFPELQGLMGRYYAAAQGATLAVAQAIEDHYKPQGPSDRVPRDPVSIAVALADKLDTLAAFWSIDEKPTGSKDPFALRRAALGVIRIILENGLRLHLLPILAQAAFVVHAEISDRKVRDLLRDGRPLDRYLAAAAPLAVHAPALAADGAPVDGPKLERELQRVTEDLLAFFGDRLKVQLREQGARHDLVDAVFALPNQDDLVAVSRRVEALGRFLDSDDGSNLLAGFRRAANILRAEEKKDGEGAFAAEPDAALLVLPEEADLLTAMVVAEDEASVEIEAENYAEAMRALAVLRPRVDAFFDKVTVNADDPQVRLNRLRLLNRLRKAALTVADVSRIEG